MKGFLLDTNVPSELVRPAPDHKVEAWIATQPLDSLFISAVSFGEVRNGHKFVYARQTPNAVGKMDRNGFIVAVSGTGLSVLPAQ